MVALIEYIKSKKGVGTLQVLLFLTFLIPFMLFCVIDPLLLFYKKQTLTHITNNACNSAVTAVNREQQKKGIVQLENVLDANSTTLSTVQNTFDKVICTDLRLNKLGFQNYQIASPSILDESPEIQFLKVYNIPGVYNETIKEKNATTGVWEDKIISITVDKPTCIVFVKYKLKTTFSRKNVTMYKYASSRAFF